MVSIAGATVMCNLSALYNIAIVSLRRQSFKRSYKSNYSSPNSENILVLQSVESNVEASERMAVLSGIFIVS